MKLEVRKILKRKQFKDTTWVLSELKELYSIVNFLNSGKCKFYGNFFKLIYLFKENKLKYWIRRYVRLYKHGINKSTLYTYCLKFGKMKAVSYYTAKIEKQKYSNSKEFLIIKHGLDKANEICYARGKSFRDSEIQRNNALKFSKKRKENPEMYSGIIPNQVDYWIKKGFTEEEAKTKVSERQNTFSLKKCIDKYGEEDGLVIFNERQEKWKNTLNMKSDEEKDRIDKSKSSVKIRIGETKEEYHNRVSVFMSNIIYDFDDLNIVLTNLYNETKYRYQPLEYFISDLPASVYNVLSSFNIKDYIISLGFKFPEKEEIFKNGRFFQMRIPEGLLRSSYEIDFYYLLKERDIKFELEKFYSNSKLKSDFYLTEFDLHIEIAGEMSNSNYVDKMKNKETLYDALILEPKQFNKFFKRIDNHGIEGIKSYIRGII